MKRGRHKGVRRDWRGDDGSGHPFLHPSLSPSNPPQSSFSRVSLLSSRYPLLVFCLISSSSAGFRACPLARRNFSRCDIHSRSLSVSAFSLAFISDRNKIEISIRFQSRAGYSRTTTESLLSVCSILFAGKWSFPIFDSRWKWTETSSRVFTQRAGRNLLSLLAML